MGVGVTVLNLGLQLLQVKCPIRMSGHCGGVDASQLCQHIGGRSVPLKCGAQQEMFSLSSKSLT